MNRKILAVCAVVMTLGFGCKPDPAPETVVAKYAEAVSHADMEKIKEVLSPDGVDEVDRLMSTPGVKAQLEASRPMQEKLWSNIRREVSPAVLSGDRARADLSLTIGKRQITMPILLYRINGQWKISYHSFAGLPAQRFQQQMTAALQAEGLLPEPVAQPNTQTEDTTKGAIKL